ncbi:hypothetical protein O181_038160 [Austropuccinia psidii MF-1]|uniref:GH16 domain-containing protein n=1 Tax=Austropuccinia psidii MF-1 TaxID=1389203 RepID=A0A9Q3HDV8_9BASI|nr:hypothetical protein [Austropuccinia psidii MF-1]
MAFQYSQDVFYAEASLRTRRPENGTSYMPHLMCHDSPIVADVTSEPYYGHSRHEWARRRDQKSDGTYALNRTLTGSSGKTEVYSYETGELNFMGDELVSPARPDEMHAFEEKAPRFGASRYISETHAPFTIRSARGCANLATLVFMTGGLVMLFAGWPMFTYFRQHSLKEFLLGFSDELGFKSVPNNPNILNLIDPDTPQDVKRRIGSDGSEYQLVFSDEFNVDGRTFWPGDDPFWEAADQHYWPTGDREWYDPDAAKTEGGALVIKIRKMDRDLNHNLEYRSAMLTSWNKMCFTGGYFEVSAVLPGRPDIGGFWPAIWMMGNLARPGYGATTDGTWPYSYNSCDVGAMPNQTHPKTGAPGSTILTKEVGDLSWQPGQKLSRCTCAGEDHPGPRNPDGSFKGRSSPELDVLEAYSYEKSGTAFGSQSLQIAPYDDKREWRATRDTTYMIYPDSGFKTNLNPFHGGNRQQTMSALATLSPDNYELAGNTSAPFGLEWSPSDGGNGYITWAINKKPIWTLNRTALSANERSMIGERLVTNEPMYMILNLGLSDTFVPVNEAALKFPATMRIDYVRFYQRKDRINVGCSPKDYPTEKYIKDHFRAYQNLNLTTWAEAGYTFPKSTLMDGCQQPA